MHMLNRIAASLLALALLAPSASARSFSQAPPAPPAYDHDDRLAIPPPVAGAPTRDAVVAALAARRAHNLAAFRAYRKAGVYPHNFVRPGPLNVWDDRDGHLCAAATMIDKDGQHALVMKTATDNNAIRLLDVTSGPLMDWILTSGFTLEEIDRIQAPMVAPVEPDPDRQINAWQVAEDARLRSEYAATDPWLVRHQKAGLAVAADRLMAFPALARKLVDATPPVSSAT